MQRLRDLGFSALSSALVFAVSLTSLSWIAVSVRAEGAEELSNLDRGGEREAIEPALPASPLYEYFEVVEGCDFAYVGECVNVRAGPSEEYKILYRLRKGAVLKIGDTIADGSRLWYRIAFAESIRYPERVIRGQYVAAENVRHFFSDGVAELVGRRASTVSTHSTTSGQAGSPQATKHIVVDRSLQKLYAYEGDTLFMEAAVSTGIDLTPTPRGNFVIYKKTPTRYMQGPLPGISEKHYDLPGVPWNLYFTEEGGVIHGAYWHNSFGQRWSNGCVNLPLDDARRLYEWAEIGTSVLVKD